MQYGGDWDDSNVHTDHIDFLRKTRRLPGKDQVQVRLAPEKEITPAPEEGERVIFHSHFCVASACRRAPSSAPSSNFISSSRTTSLQTRWC